MLGSTRSFSKFVNKPTYETRNLKSGDEMTRINMMLSASSGKKIMKKKRFSLLK